jgi:uncharacterized protein (TIGR02646 family)
MKNVPRLAEPASLRRSRKQWTRELLAARSEKTPDKRRLKILEDRYKKVDVRDTLDEMYGGRCCYCEADIALVAFGHIEHRKPKSRFPRSCFAWNNMHLACPRCNQAKSEKWVEKSPILDSVTDVPIEDHLTYDWSDVLGVLRIAKTARGRTTIDHARLNTREPLLKARRQVAQGALRTITELNLAPDSLRASELRLELEAKTEGEFGSMVQWLLDVLLRTA